MSKNEVESCCEQKYPTHGETDSFVLLRSQSYKIKLVFKKSKFVLNPLTMSYLNLDLTTILLQ